MDTVAQSPPMSATQRAREFIGLFLYSGMKDPHDPPWDQLDPSERTDFCREARGAMRQCDPCAQDVAEEMAAQAYATEQGWDWPSLHGMMDTSGRPRELVVIEARQKIRHFARVMCRAYVKHLQDGGVDEGHSFEESFREAVKRQNAEDAERRLALKPKCDIRPFVGPQEVF